eukprot:588109-Pyramimonas_sp.AAC.1
MHVGCKPPPGLVHIHRDVRVHVAAESHHRLRTPSVRSRSREGSTARVRQRREHPSAVFSKGLIGLCWWARTPSSGGRWIPPRRIS